jgi:hypothetical protein
MKKTPPRQRGAADLTPRTVENPRFLRGRAAQRHVLPASRREEWTPTNVVLPKPLRPVPPRPRRSSPSEAHVRRERVERGAVARLGLGAEGRALERHLRIARPDRLAKARNVADTRQSDRRALDRDGAAFDVDADDSGAEQAVCDHLDDRRPRRSRGRAAASRLQRRSTLRPRHAASGCAWPAPLSPRGRRTASTPGASGRCRSSRA